MIKLRGSSPHEIGPALRQQPGPWPTRTGGATTMDSISPRPLCAYCGRRPVGPNGVRYCSPRCGSLSRFPPVEDRFWAQVQKSDGCWLWTGGIFPTGYGWFNVSGKMLRAHRFSWELHFGPIPDGKIVCHHCDNPACVRPDHLFLGTAQDNKDDCVAKGRQATGDRNGSRIHPERLARGEDHGRAKLTEEDVREIRALLASGDSKSDLGRRFGVTHGMIRHIAAGRSWRHVK